MLGFRALQMYVFVGAGAFCSVVPAEQPASVPGDASVTGWLADLKAAFEKAYRERVVDVYGAKLKVAKQDYAEQIERLLKDAERAGDKQAEVVLRQESERVSEESWRMHSNDQDTSLETVRRARRIYRERLPELNQAWDEESRKLVSEFESALLLGAQRLTSRNLEGEVRRVLACRQELVAMWLPRMWEVHRGTRLTAPTGNTQKVGSSGEGIPGSGATVNRKVMEETVKWVLEGQGAIQIIRNGKIEMVRKVGDLPKGKVEFWSVALNRKKFDRLSGSRELSRLGQLRGLRILSLGWFDIDAEDWEFLAGIRQLECLNLSVMRMDLGAATWIGRCKNLRTLEMGNCEGLTAEIFQRIALGIPGLRNLKLSGSLMPDVAGMELGRFEQLEVLMVDGTGLTPAVIPSWAGLRALRTLVWSGGPWSREVFEGLGRHPIEKLGFLDSDAAEFPSQMAWLGELFPKLRFLDLKGGSLSVTHAEALAENLKSLEGLNMYSVQPSVEAAKVLQRLPHLRALYCHAVGIGDQVFQEFLAIRSLKFLDVAGTAVSDQSAGAIYRAGASGLHGLNLEGTQVSKGAMDSLERRIKGLSLRAAPFEAGLVP